jgi:hypothetical protein
MACAAPLSLDIVPHETNVTVSRIAWSLFLHNAEEVGGRTFVFDDLELRYYLDRNGAVEPLIVAATQANLHLVSGESRALPGRWLVERVEDSTDAGYNAYVSITFDDPGQFFPGDRIDLYQQLATGFTETSNFDQRANYSFPGGQEQAASWPNWTRVTIHYRGELVWGVEPLPVNPRSCFVKAVNFNGPSLPNVDGHPWQSAADAGVTTTGTGISQASALHPLASAGLTTALGTATRLLAGQSLDVPVDDGEYLVYLYAVSATQDTTPSELTVQGQDHANSTRFKAQPIESGYAWARLGPYRVGVTTGAPNVAVTLGSIHFAGVELWYPE